MYGIKRPRAQARSGSQTRKTTRLRDLLDSPDPLILADPDSSPSASRDAPFLFTREIDPDYLAEQGVELPRSGNKLTAATRLITETIIASANGRCMSYSRRKEHYGTANKRYFGPAYNYESVVEGAANPLIKAGFFLEDRALPGDHMRTHRQSRLWASSEIVAELLDAPVIEHPPHDPIWLRNSDKDPVDYRDTARTISWRRHLTRFNSFMSDADVRCGSKAHTNDLRQIFSNE